MAIAATARRPATTEPTFLFAAPVKLFAVDDGLVLEPVTDAVGTIGEPVAPAPEAPEAPAAGPTGVVPVATGAVPVAKPVEPATPEDLTRMSVIGALGSNHVNDMDVRVDLGLGA